MNRAVDVTLGCKVHNRPRLMLFEQLSHQRLIANITMDKKVTGIIF